MELPVKYHDLNQADRRLVRKEYIRRQGGKCWACGGDITKDPPDRLKKFRVNWTLFPRNFMKYPIHLQHDHDTGFTEGAVHALCNALLWQYHGR